MARAIGPTLGALMLTAACGEAAVAENNAASAKAPPAAAAATPEAVAQRMVRRQLGEAEVRFGAARTYRNDGVAIVCGSYSRGAGARQRFVAVGDLDVWLEPDMQPGQMDRAFAEFCRDGSANA